MVYNSSSTLFNNTFKSVTNISWVENERSCHLFQLGVGHFIFGLKFGRFDGQRLLHLFNLTDGLCDLVQTNVEMKLFFFLSYQTKITVITIIEGATKFLTQLRYL